MSSPSAVVDPSTPVTSLVVPQSSSSQKSNTTSNTSSRNGSFGKDSNTPRGGGDGGIPGPSTHQIVGTYTAEETAFHRAFPAVPLSEKLVDQYQCSVMRNKVVRLGKLYLTNTRLCFTSTFLRDPVNLPWEAVASVQRRTNFLFDSVVVKRTKEAMDAQHHARHHNHHHGHSRSLSQGAAEVLGADSEARTSNGGGTSSQRQSEGPVVDHALNEQLYGSGGVGDEEALTGFISGSSDQAFRMIQMLWSVRSRYNQQKKDEEDTIQRSMSTENLSNATTGGTPMVVVPAIESPHLGGSGGAGGGGSSSSSTVDGSSPLVLHHNDETGEDVTTTVLTPMDRELQPPSTHKLVTLDNTKDPLGDDTADAVVTPTTPGGRGGGDAFSDESSAAAQKKKKSRTMSAYVSSSFKSSMSAVSSVMPSSTGLRLTPRASTTTAKPSSVIPTSASPEDSINPPYVLHPSDDETGGTPEEGSASDEDDSADESSPRNIPQPMSPLQQAAGVAAGDVNAHRYTALLLKSFPLVPKNEVVIESFQCSYVSGVHRLGRLYVTSNYLLFSSPFMSEGLVIRLVDAASVSRWQTMKVLDGLSIDIRPDARAVTTTQLCQAGGAIPAAAINSSRVSPVLNPASSAVTAEANDDNAAAPSSPNTPRSRTSSLMRQETQEPTMSEDGVASLRGSSTPQNLSMTSSSSHAAFSDSGVVYTKASYAFTSFVGSRDAALKLIRHLHAPHYIRAEEAVDATKEATQNLAINTISVTPTDGITSPTAGASSSSPTTTSPTIAATMSPTTTTTTKAAVAPVPPAAAVRPPNDAAFYITAPKVEDTYTALKTVYGTDLSPIGNFFGGDNSKKLLAEQPVYFPEGVGLMDVFRDTWSDDTRAIDQYHSDRKDTEMSWTKWAPIATCEGHTAVTTQLAEAPASSLGSEASAASEFLPPSKAGQRVLKCKTLVKAVGSTVCDFTEYQKYAFLKVPASDQYGSSGVLGGFPPPPSAKADGNRRLLIVQISGQAVGAMFSDTFRAEALCIFEEEVIGATSSSAASYHPLSTSLKAGDVGASTAAPPRVRVSMVCYGHIQFVKSVWGIKGKIVSVALGVEMPECYRNFFGNQMKPLALKLIKSRQQNQPTAVSSSVEVVEIGGGAAGPNVLTTLSSSPSPPQGGELTTTTTTTYAASSPNTSSSQSNQLLQVQQTSSSGSGGSGVSLRSSFSPEHLFPFAGFSPTSTSNTPLQMGLLGFVAFIAFLSVWWSAWGLLSCLWGSLSLPVATPSTDSTPVGIVGGNSGGGSVLVESTTSMVATVAYVEAFNTYLRPLMGVLFGSVLAMSVSVLVEYVLCLLK